jgi:hypothetical protein
MRMHTGLGALLCLTLLALLTGCEDLARVTVDCGAECGYSARVIVECDFDTRSELHEVSAYFDANDDDLLNPTDPPLADAVYMLKFADGHVVRTNTDAQGQAKVAVTIGSRNEPDLLCSQKYVIYGSTVQPPSGYELSWQDGNRYLFRKVIPARADIAAWIARSEPHDVIISYVSANDISGLAEAISITADGTYSVTSAGTISTSHLSTAAIESIVQEFFERGFLSLSSVENCIYDMTQPPAPDSTWQKTAEPTSMRLSIHLGNRRNSVSQTGSCYSVNVKGARDSRPVDRINALVQTLRDTPNRRSDTASR